MTTAGSPRMESSPQMSAQNEMTGQEIAQQFLLSPRSSGIMSAGTPLMTSSPRASSVMSSPQASSMSYPSQGGSSSPMMTSASPKAFSLVRDAPSSVSELLSSPKMMSPGFMEGRAPIKQFSPMASLPKTSVVIPEETSQEDMTETGPEESGETQEELGEEQQNENQQESDEQGEAQEEGMLPRMSIYRCSPATERESMGCELVYPRMQAGGQTQRPGTAPF